MKKFCKSLREHAMEIINFKKKKLKLLANKHLLLLQIDPLSPAVLGFKYTAPKEIPIVLHNASNNDYLFTIKESGEEFEGIFNFSEKILKNT